MVSCVNPESYHIFSSGCGCEFYLLWGYFHTRWSKFPCTLIHLKSLLSLPSFTAYSFVKCPSHSKDLFAHTSQFVATIQAEVYPWLCWQMDKVQRLLSSMLDGSGSIGEVSNLLAGLKVNTFRLSYFLKPYIAGLNSQHEDPNCCALSGLSINFSGASISSPLLLHGYIFYSFLIQSLI